MVHLTLTLSRGTEEIPLWVHIEQDIDKNADLKSEGQILFEMLVTVLPGSTYNAFREAMEVYEEKHKRSSYNDR
jgi:hypothetical protein